MNLLSVILINLQAVIAAKAARDSALTVLMVALWGRVARMRTRLERLIALWRAGKLPVARAAVVRERGPRAKPLVRFPNAPGWLRRKLGHEVSALGSQLQHLLTEDECKAFLEACPRAGRVLRPLLRMLTVDAVPAVVRRVMPVVVPMVLVEGEGLVVAPEVRFSRG